MKLQSENKIDPSFNMSSMTDMIFLLLIFFLLTSNFATPSGLPINTPSSKAAQKVMPEINVGVTKDGQYFVNEVKTDLTYLEDYLADIMKGQEGLTVVISIDKDAPTQYLINVAGVAAKLKAKTVVSAKPE